MTAQRPLLTRALRFGQMGWPSIKPRRDLPLLTIVLLLTSAPEQWYLRAPLIALFALGVVFRSWLVRPQFWYAVATLLGATVYLTWESSDNHKYLFVYWCLALCCAFTLPKPQQEEALALSSRWLIGLSMALAVAWKLVTPDYTSGTFFHYELLCDARFENLASWLTGMPAASLAENRELRELVQSGYVRGLVVSEVPLADSRSLWVLAQAMTWWTIGIEGFLAVLFLWPDRSRHAPRDEPPADRQNDPTGHITRSVMATSAGHITRSVMATVTLRNAALLLFAATTYFVAPVRGFGWMLMLLGLAQCRDEERHLRLAYLAALVLIQAYTLPVGALLSLVGQ